jgi:hypothetical protein
MVQYLYRYINHVQKIYVAHQTTKPNQFTHRVFDCALYLVYIFAHTHNNAKINDLASRFQKYTNLSVQAPRVARVARLIYQYPRLTLFIKKFIKKIVKRVYNPHNPRTKFVSA